MARTYTVEQEHRLAAGAQAGDRQARDLLVLDHLWLVKTAAIKSRFLHGRELREVGSVPSVAPDGTRQLIAKGLRRLQAELTPTWVRTTWEPAGESRRRGWDVRGPRASLPAPTGVRGAHGGLGRPCQPTGPPAGTPAGSRRADPPPTRSTRPISRQARLPMAKWGRLGLGRHQREEAARLSADRP